MNKTHNGNILKRKQSILERIQILDYQEEKDELSNQERHERMALKDYLHTILLQEEILWRRSARIQCIKNGDKNTKFFHAYASARKRKNTISKVEANGTHLDNQDDIREAFIEFYSNLYCTTGPSDIRLNWKQLFGEERLDQSKLEKPFTEDEIKAAVFSSAKDKAPGPDGFPMSFYERYWSTIKQDINRLFEDLHGGKADLSRINYAFLTLVFKKVENLSLGDYRPVA